MTAEMNSKILCEFTSLEVKKAIFQMNPLSSPGLDGFPFHFYQENWLAIGDNVYQFVLNVLKHDGSL